MQTSLKKSLPWVRRAGTASGDECLLGSVSENEGAEGAFHSGEDSEKTAGGVSGAATPVENTGIRA